MVYRAIGLMSGSSLDGLDIAFVEFHETSGRWSYEIKASACYPYDEDWQEKLRTATTLKALDYQLLHTSFGHYLGKLVNQFIEDFKLQFQVQLIASHGHTTFHVPSKRMTAQLGDGAALAASTGINVVSDLRSMDVAHGGHGAPIVPIGEKLLLGDYEYFMNLGGIANISYNHPSEYIAFDICPANRVLNMLSADVRKNFDEGGAMAATGEVDEDLLGMLNDLEYYRLPYPKSLSNDFGTDVVYPIIQGERLSTQDALGTYVEHIAIQVSNAITMIAKNHPKTDRASRLLVTGGGAHNGYLIKRISELLQKLNVEVIVADAALIDFKEAMIMALIGVLRWREENNVFSSVTGSARDSIGGAVWIGQEA